MNRAERRQQQRKLMEFEKKQLFTKAEVDAMNAYAYEVGVNHALESAWINLGIGPARQQKIRDGLKLLQQLDFEHYLQKLDKKGAGGHGR